MELELKNKCDVLEENFKNFSKLFKYDNRICIQSCALLYAINGKKFNKEFLLECKEDIKNHYSTFSTMRGINYPLVTTLLSFYKHPLEALYVIQDIYKQLRKSFSDSSYLSSVCFVLYNNIKTKDIEPTVLRIKKLYKKIKKEHPFLTNSEDAPLISLLVLTKKSDDEILFDVEECFKLLKKNFHYMNPRQSLSHVLALYDEDSKTKCDRVNALYEEYKNQGIKYSKGTTLPLLGVQAMSTEDYVEDVKNVKEMEEYIRKFNKFSSFYISKEIRLAYATSLMIDYHDDRKTIKNTVITNVMLVALIQQTIMLYTVIAATAASSVNN